MADAWIYVDPDEPDLASEFARELAELGFSPRQVSANGRLAPDDLDGAVARRAGLRRRQKVGRDGFRWEPYERFGVARPQPGVSQMPNAAYFRRQADLCFRLACFSNEEEVTNRLVAMAEDYRTRAAKQDGEAFTPALVPEAPDNQTER